MWRGPPHLHLPSLGNLLTAALFVLPRKLVVGCGLIPVHLWSLALGWTLVAMSGIVLMRAYRQDAIRRGGLTVGVALTSVAVGILALPRIPLVRIITPC